MPQAPAQAVPPPTLPADFSGFDNVAAPKSKVANAKKPPPTLPANFSGFDGAAPSESDLAASLNAPAQAHATVARIPFNQYAHGAPSGAYTPTHAEQDAATAAYLKAHPVADQSLVGSVLPPPPDTRPTTFTSRAANEVGNIARGTFAPPNTPFGTIPNPVESVKGVAQGVSERAQEFKQHPAAAAGATATDIAAILLPFVAHEAIGRANAALEPRRVQKGIESVGKGAGIPSSPEAAALSSRGAPDAVNIAADLHLAAPDLAAIERANPVTTKGSASIFARAKSVLDYNRNLWEQAHAAPVSRHPLLPIDHEALASAGQSVLSTEAVENAQSAGRQAQRWVDTVAAKPRNLSSADQLLREINSDLESSAKSDRPYPPLVVRAKVAVADALRKQIELTLTNAGETGVAEANQRYGALRNIADKLIDAGVSESKAEGKKGALPPWLNVYTFMHPGSISGGISVHPGSLFHPTPSKQIGKGMSRLADTGLRPPAMPSAPPTPPVKGLLPAPATPLPAPPDTSGSVTPQTPPKVWTDTEREQVRRSQLPPPPAVAQVGGPPPGPAFPATTPNPMWAGAQPQPGFDTASHLTSPMRPQENVKAAPAPKEKPPAPPAFYRSEAAPLARKYGLIPREPSAPGLVSFQDSTTGGSIEMKDGFTEDQLAAKVKAHREAMAATGPSGKSDLQKTKRDQATSRFAHEAAPATGTVKTEFGKLKVYDLVTPRQQATLETMMNGPRWRDMEALDKQAAIRTILQGGKPAQ